MLSSENKDLIIIIIIISHGWHYFQKTQTQTDTLLEILVAAILAASLDLSQSIQRHTLTTVKKL